MDLLLGCIQKEAFINTIANREHAFNLGGPKNALALIYLLSKLAVMVMLHI